MSNKLQLLRIFCAAAEAKNFKEAAAKLGISPQAVTRAIQDLEGRLGELLFHRNTRQIHITDFGEQLAERARESINTVDDLFQPQDRKADHNGINGLIRITAPITLGHHILLPILTRIREEYPNISIDLRLADLITNVVDQKIDIGIRVGFLHDSSFIAKAIAKVSFMVVATPELAARVGMPKQPQDLGELPTIALVDKNTGKTWPWYFANAQQFIPKTPAFVTDDPETELALTLRGVGYAQLPAFLAMQHIESGKLVAVLKPHIPAPWELYIYRPQRGPVPQRIRVVYDLLSEALAKHELFPIITAPDRPLRSTQIAMLG